MDKQYLAINGALFFWLLALIAWSVDASALAIKKGGVFSGRAEMLAAAENKSHILGLVADAPSKADAQPVRPQSA